MFNIKSVGFNPTYIFVTSKPCQLTFCVMTAFSLDILRNFGNSDLSVKIRCELLVTYCLKSIAISRNLYGDGIFFDISFCSVTVFPEVW